MSTGVSLFHFVIILLYCFSFWYDIKYVHIPRPPSVIDEYMLKGRLKFLTIWNLMSARSLCHFIAAVHFWFGCYYDWNYVEIPLDVHKMGSSFGKSGKLKFLTFWDAILQAVFFTICFVNDIAGNNEYTPKKSPFIRRLKDTILTCLAFPLSMFVGLTFWGIYFVDRELIFPRALDKFFPVWLNHVMHTNIMIFILIEMYTSCRKYPSRKFGLSVLSIFMLIYLIWIHIIHTYSGFWVYPILDVLNFPLRIVFFVGLFALTLCLYVFGEKLNSMIWNKRLLVKKVR